MLRFCLTVCLWFGLALSPVAADDPVAAAKSVIERQIAAFLDDDPAAAYAFASPQIKSKFPDQATFFEMVKKSYAPVYRPDNFTFGRSKVDAGSVIQEVVISGADGKPWTALYLLLRQPDGSYKINGVQLLQQPPGREI